MTTGDPHTTTDPSAPPAAHPSLMAATRVWARIGCLSFGGPAGQIALMHRELVDERRWISESRFLHALSYCMLLPGPEAQQLAVYIGWLTHRTVGGLVAGILFVLPGMLVMLTLSTLYAVFGQVPAISALFYGLKAAVLAVVVDALLRISKRALKNRLMLAIAAIAFLGIFFFKIPFPIIVIGAALLGVLAQRLLPELFQQGEATAQRIDTGYLVDSAIARGGLMHIRPSTPRALLTLVIHLVLWFTPVVLVALWLGSGSVLGRQGAFFSWTAVITFGGAYAVLAYVAQQVVEKLAWITPGQMLDGLALAETTPGPLILVLQFVAFLAAYQNPGTLPPLAAGVLGSLLTIWVTFVPCFLWIFLGAPYIEALRNSRVLRAALSAITAAVVGVILNLSVWFTLHTVFGEIDERNVGPLHLMVPQWNTLDIGAALIGAAAMIAMLRFQVSMGWVLLVSAMAGTAWKMLG